MTLTEFRYIVALARERHFGRAAAACHVSQPTLSVAVRRLEEELGVALFERDRNRIRVTPEGGPVIEQAERVLAEAETLRELAAGARDPLTGPLRLGAIHTIGPYLFPSLIPRLRERAPRMPLVVEENFTTSLIRRLQAGELDAVVLALPCAASGVEIEDLYDEPFSVVMPIDHPWRELAEIEPERLAREHVLLLGAGHCFRDQVLMACPDCADTTQTAGNGDPGLESASLETIRHMVASGTGVSVLPCTAVAGGREGDSLLAIRPFTAPRPRRRVALVWRRTFPQAAAIDTLAEVIRECGLPGVEPVVSKRGDAPAADDSHRDHRPVHADEVHDRTLSGGD